MRILRKSDRGVILVAVLLAISVLFIVASIVSAQSVLTTRQSLNSQLREQQYYDNESLQAKIIYKAYTDRRFRSQNLLAQAEEGVDPYVPDSQQRYHENEYSKINFKIKDAMTGLPLWDSSQTLLVKQLADQFIQSNEEMADEINRYFVKLKDYQDLDDIPQVNGGDEGELYDSPLLPRNGSIQFIEELLWVPQELYQGNLYDALGLSLSYAGQIDEIIQVPTTIGKVKALRSRFRRPSFLLSSNESIATKLQLTAQEKGLVVEAKKAWREEKTPLQQGLGELYSRLSKHYSFSVSNIYSIVQEARNRDNLSPVILKTTVDINRILNVRDAEKGYISFIRRLIY